MKSSSGSGDPDHIRARIQSWFDSPPTEGKEIRAVELVHDHDKARVQLWPVTRRTNISEVAAEIYERACEDAEGGGDIARFVLQPYYADSMKPNGRHRFFIQPSNTAPDELDATSLTEGPTAKGAFAQHMRFTEGSFRSSIVNSNQLFARMSSENDRMGHECERLRDENHKLRERIQTLEDLSFERQIKWRRVLFWEKIREETFKSFLPFAPMMGGALLKRFNLLGSGPTPAPNGSAPANGHANGQVNGAAKPPAMTNGAPDPKQMTSGSGGEEKPPSIEARFRRLWNALSPQQKQGFINAAMSIGLSPLQLMPAGELAMQLNGPETHRPHEHGKSLLEHNAQTLIGSFESKQWAALCTGLSQKGGWSPQHIAIFNAIAKDLMRDARAFEDAIETPRPRPPEMKFPDKIRVPGPLKNPFLPMPSPVPVQEPETPSPAPVSKDSGKKKKALTAKQPS